MTHDWLPEVFFERCVSERAEVDPVEVVLVPEVDLVDLLHVEGLVGEGGNVEVASGREHATAGLEPLLGVEVSLEHALVQKHVTERRKNCYRLEKKAHRKCSSPHWFRDDHVDLLWQLDLLNLSRNDLDDVADLVGSHQGIGVLGNAGRDIKSRQGI